MRIFVQPTSPPLDNPESYVKTKMSGEGPTSPRHSESNNEVFCIIRAPPERFDPRFDEHGWKWGSATYAASSHTYTRLPRSTTKLRMAFWPVSILVAVFHLLSHASHPVTWWGKLISIVSHFIPFFSFTRRPGRNVEKLVTRWINLWYE